MQTDEDYSYLVVLQPVLRLIAHPANNKAMNCVQMSREAESLIAKKISGDRRQAPSLTRGEQFETRNLGCQHGA